MTTGEIIKYILLMNFPIVVFVVYVVYRFLISERWVNDKAWEKTIIRPKYSEISKLPILMTEKEIKKIDSKLDVDKFMKDVYKIFCDYENAIQNYDYDVLESILGHDLKVLKIEQVQELEEKGIQKITKNIVNLGGGIYHIYKYGPIEKIDVLLIVHRTTYFVDKKSKNVISGCENCTERVSYHLTFESTLNGVPSNCPNCGGEIDSDEKSKCKFCNTIIKNTYGDFNMIFKETLRIESVEK